MLQQQQQQLQLRFAEKQTSKQRAISDEPQRVLARYPHKLNDNLHWHCSTCGNVVSTNKTKLHLITCLMTFSSLTADDQCCDTANSSGQDSMSCQSVQTINCCEQRSDERVMRPRTKRLERPTPNIKHPIISVASKNKSLQKHSSNNSLKVSAKSYGDSKKTKSSETSSENREKREISSQPQKPVIKKFVKKLDLSNPCKSCTTGSEKFHSHSVGVQKLTNTIQNINTNSGSSVEKRLLTLNNDNKITEDNINSSLLKCYICENEFDTETLPIHEPSCLEKWKQTNVGLPADQRLPQKQKRRESLTTGSGCDPAGWEHFKSQLCPCRTCGRTFFPHRLAVHEKACKGSEDARTEAQKEQGRVSLSISHRKLTAKTLPQKCFKCECVIKKSGEKCIHYKNTKESNVELGDSSDEQWQNHLEKLQPCARCGRTFFPDRLRVHQPNCKAKPVSDFVTFSTES